MKERVSPDRALFGWPSRSADPTPCAIAETPPESCGRFRPLQRLHPWQGTKEGNGNTALAGVRNCFPAQCHKTFARASCTAFLVCLGAPHKAAASSGGFDTGGVFSVRSRVNSPKPRSDPVSVNNVHHLLQQVALGAPPPRGTSGRSASEWVPNGEEWLASITA